MPNKMSHLLSQHDSRQVAVRLRDNECILKGVAGGCQAVAGGGGVQGEVKHFHKTVGQHHELHLPMGGGGHVCKLYVTRYLLGRKTELFE